MEKILDATGLETVCRLAKNKFSSGLTEEELEEYIETTEYHNSMERNTWYDVGDVVESEDVPLGCVLQCIRAGTTSS
jgi:hypothetical protein